MPNAIAEPGVAAALPHAEAQVLAVADGDELGELAAVDEQRHAGIAEPERRQTAELRAQIEMQLAPGTIASTRVTRPQVVLGQHRVGVRGERSRERLDALGRDRQPGGGAMAAEALEVRRRTRRAPPCRSKADTDRPEPFQSPSVPAIITTGRL